MSDKEIGEEQVVQESKQPPEESSKDTGNGQIQADSEDEEWIGPMPTEAASEQPPAKKRKVLLYEKLFLESLPNSESYEKSYMHRDIVTHIVVSKTDFISKFGSNNKVYIII